MGNERENGTLKQTPAAKQRSGNVTRILVVIAALVLLAFFLFNGKITVEYMDTGVTLRGGVYRTEVYFDQVQDVQMYAGPFEIGQPVDGVEKEQYVVGVFSGGSLTDVETYSLYLDQGFLGDVVVIYYADSALVVGSAGVDLPFLYDYMREGAGLSNK